MFVGSARIHSELHGTPVGRTIAEIRGWAPPTLCSEGSSTTFELQRIREAKAPSIPLLIARLIAVISESLYRTLEFFVGKKHMPFAVFENHRLYR